MALTRLNAFATGTTLTNLQLTGEYDNIYNNALTLISPLTGDLACGGFRLTGLAAGTIGSPAIQFSATNGIYSPAANQIGVVTAGAETLRITDRLLMGTTLSTGGDGSVAADIIFKNGSGVKFVNAAGTGLVRGYEMTTTGDRILIAGGGADIQWGRGLVALGGGAAPTLGTIGGAGPATAGQNSWMRVFDSTNAVFWVPAWK